MVICITTKCDLICPHCALSCDINGEDMEEETLLSAISFFNQSGSRYIQVSGGEPTGHPKFFSFLTKILKETKSKDITLLSNGKFLYDKDKSKRLAALQKKYGFDIQISAIKNLYPNFKKTIEMFYKRWNLFKSKQTYIVSKLTVMDSLGRAKGKDFSYLGTFYKRKFPSCLNQFNIAKEYNGIKSLPELFKLIEDNTQYNKCKPLISPDGTINPGENNRCNTPGRTSDINCKDYLEFLRSNHPCGKCGI